jgi:thioredoxin 1
MKLLHLTLSFLTFLSVGAAQALEVKPYEQASFATAQASGKSTALHFHADWCPVCKKQSDSIELLKADKSLNVTIFVANYDLEEPLKKQLGVKAQSTLIVYKGGVEKGRLAGQTSTEAIKATLVKAL